jgi:hypothetical protein
MLQAGWGVYRTSIIEGYEIVYIGNIIGRQGGVCKGRR